jgi:hypothetical protein
VGLAIHRVDVSDEQRSAPLVPSAMEGVDYTFQVVKSWKTCRSVTKGTGCCEKGSKGRKKKQAKE